MAINVLSDRINNASLEKRYDQITYALLYFRCVRVMVVENIPDLAGEPHTVFEQALAEVGISAGAGFPGASGEELLLRVVGFKCTPISGTPNIEVQVSYEYTKRLVVPGEYTVECLTGLESVLVDTDYNDAPIGVNYYPDTERGQPVTGPVETSYAAVPALRPFSIRAFTMQLHKADAEAVVDAQPTYVGYTNTSTWLGKAAQTWLCLKIDVTAQPYKGFYLARMEFGYKPRGWKARVRYTSTRYGTPSNLFWAPGVNTNNGFNEVQIYGTADLAAALLLITP